MIQFCGAVVTASPLAFILLVILMAFRTAEGHHTAYIHFSEGKDGRRDQNTIQRTKI